MLPSNATPARGLTPSPASAALGLPPPASGASLPARWQEHPLLASHAPVHHSLMARLVFDLDVQNYVHYDEGIAAVTGFRPEDFAERGGLEFFLSRYDQTSAPVSAAIVTDLFVTLQRLPHEQQRHARASAVHRFRLASGEPAWLLSQSVPLLTAEAPGRLRHTLSYISNITPHYFLARPTGSITFPTGLDAQGEPHAYTTLELPLRKPQPGLELSPREGDVLRLIVAGRTSKEIAEALTLAPPTVNTHRKNLLVKTRCRNTAELVRFAVSYGLV